MRIVKNKNNKAMTCKCGGVMKEHRKGGIVCSIGGRGCKARNRRRNKQ